MKKMQLADISLDRKEISIIFQSWYNFSDIWPKIRPNNLIVEIFDGIKIELALITVIFIMLVYTYFELLVLEYETKQWCISRGMGSNSPRPSQKKTELRLNTHTHHRRRSRGGGGRVPPPPPRIFLGGSSPPRFLKAWKISIHIFAF